MKNFARVLTITMVVSLFVGVSLEAQNRNGSHSGDRQGVTRGQKGPRPNPVRRATPPRRNAVRRSPVVIRPRVYRNYSSGYGYGGYYGFMRPPLQGIKIDLGLIPGKNKKEVRKGVVKIDGYEMGLVDSHDGWQNSPIDTTTGEHEVSVELEDETFRTTVYVPPLGVVRVAPRFQKF